MAEKLNLYLIECYHARKAGAQGRGFYVMERREFQSAEMAETWFRAVYETLNGPPKITLLGVGTESK